MSRAGWGHGCSAALLCLCGYTKQGLLSCSKFLLGLPYLQHQMGAGADLGYCCKWQILND